MNAADVQHQEPSDLEVAYVRAFYDWLSTQKERIGDMSVRFHDRTNSVGGLLHPPRDRPYIVICVEPSSVESVPVMWCRFVITVDTTKCQIILMNSVMDICKVFDLTDPDCFDQVFGLVLELVEGL